ncbi:hypothetical protein OSB04_006975 [Centaurea solstitialis]|uniref:BZIP domain-containing protein n=1 Tax=Centaurea solstitialis TaxID=347529 RepID=A0AA38WQL3_9ASTR|nr:hypothetical protein OSB04_006975 [Centaurea solstitialis]
MLSSDGDDFNRNQHNLSGIRVPTRSTTSSSSSTISSNHSPPPPSSRTMEEVWKDINLTTTNHPATTAKAYPGFIFQDFLAKPFSTTTTNDNTPTRISPSPPPPPPPVAHPPMLLNLNSGPDQMSFLSEDPTRNVCPFDQVLASANSSSGGLLSNGIGGGMWMLPATDRTGGDRRHKRMIKNRESAARSRARKQAYTNQLENEVDRLKEENARLKRQHQQLQMATAASQVTKKGGLQRATTAPF